MTVLLDANLLIALGILDHVHHEATEAWFLHCSKSGTPRAPSPRERWCRLAVRHGATARDAIAVLASVISSPGHEFWPDDAGYDRVQMTGVVGQRQVTDAYLAGLARHHKGRLATLDRGLAALHPDIVVLVPALV